MAVAAATERPCSTDSPTPSSGTGGPPPAVYAPPGGPRVDPYKRRTAMPSSEAAPALLPSNLPEPPSAVVARVWEALRTIEDPEIPVSLVDMGLIVSVGYEPAARTAALQVTFTAMGCPAMDMIQDDIRQRLLRDPAIDAVELQVVWDPAWTRERLSASARATMRELGIAA